MASSDRKRALRWRSINPLRDWNRPDWSTSQLWKRWECPDVLFSLMAKSPRNFSAAIFFGPKSKSKRKSKRLKDVDLGGVIVRDAAPAHRPRFVAIVSNGIAPY